MSRAIIEPGGLRAPGLLEVTRIRWARSEVRPLRHLSPNYRPQATIFVGRSDGKSERPERESPYFQVLGGAGKQLSGSDGVYRRLSRTSLQRLPRRVCSVGVCPLAVCASFAKWTKVSLVQEPEGDESDEYRSWQRLPGSERIRAVWISNLDLYTMKGQAGDAPRPSKELLSAFNAARFD